MEITKKQIDWAIDLLESPLENEMEPAPNYERAVGILSAVAYSALDQSTKAKEVPKGIEEGISVTTLSQAWEQFKEKHKDWPHETNWDQDIPVGWGDVPVLEVREGWKAVITTSEFAECFFSFHAQPWSETEPGEPTGRVWITGPHAKIRNKIRTRIKKETGIDIRLDLSL